MPKIQYFPKILLSCTKASNSYPENHTNLNIGMFQMPTIYNFWPFSLLCLHRSVRVESIPRVRMETGRETLPPPDTVASCAQQTAARSEAGGLCLSRCGLTMESPLGSQLSGLVEMCLLLVGFVPVFGLGQCPLYQLSAPSVKR